MPFKSKRQQQLLQRHDKRRKSMDGELIFWISKIFNKTLELMNQNLGVNRMDLTDSSETSIGIVQYFQLYCKITVACKLNVFNDT